MARPGASRADRDAGHDTARQRIETFTEIFTKLQNFLYSFMESVKLSIRYDTVWQPASDGARPGPAQRSRIRVVDARDCEMTRKVAMMKHMLPCKYKNSRTCLLVKLDRRAFKYLHNTFSHCRQHDWRQGCPNREALPRDSARFGQP